MFSRAEKSVSHSRHFDARSVPKIDDFERVRYGFLNSSCSAAPLKMRSKMSTMGRAFLGAAGRPKTWWIKTFHFQRVNCKKKSRNHPFFLEKIAQVSHFQWIYYWENGRQLHKREPKDWGVVGTGHLQAKLKFCLEFFKCCFYIETCFGHNFFQSARIELRFFEVANLEKLNNFYHGHFKCLLTKKWFFWSSGLYLARARARARALGQASSTGGEAWPPARSKKQLKNVLTRARWNLALFRARGAHILCGIAR